MDDLAFFIYLEDEETIDYLHKYLPAAERPLRTYRSGSTQVILLIRAPVMCMTR